MPAIQKVTRYRLYQDQSAVVARPHHKDITNRKEEVIMSNIYKARQKRQSLVTVILAMAAVSGIIFAFGTAKAEDPTPSEAAVAEMKKMLGGVPAELQVYPESAKAAGWEMMKAADFNKNTALPSKVRELIGLAVSAQIPCRYCVYYHIKAAKAAGATEEELREAVHQASLTRHWSTILYGNQYDFEMYKSEIDAAFKSP
jgi:AhpD family alkylhydroperoxidase